MKIEKLKKLEVGESVEFEGKWAVNRKHESLWMIYYKKFPVTSYRTLDKVVNHLRSVLASLADNIGGALSFIDDAKETPGSEEYVLQLKTAQSALEEILSSIQSEEDENN